MVEIPYFLHHIIIVRGSSSFVINADSCFVKVQGFIFYFTLTFRIISPPHLTSLGTVFFLIPQLLLRRGRLAALASRRRSQKGAIIVSCYCDEFFGSPQKNFAKKEGLIFWTDGRTEDGQTDGQEFCGNFG
jgi:hypothetical protein